MKKLLHTIVIPKASLWFRIKSAFCRLFGLPSPWRTFVFDDVIIEENKEYIITFDKLKNENPKL